MQEHSNANKDQESPRTRRSNPIHIVEGARMGPSSAEALREVHMSLVRAEQNLFNLVQAAGHGSSSPTFGPAAFGYGGQPAYAPGFAPGFAPAYPPAFPSAAAIPTPSHLAYGVSPAAWASTPQQPWATAPSAITPWSALGPGLAPQGLSPAFASPAFAPAMAPFGIAGRIPACDILDEGKQYVCHVDLPGLRGDQIELLCLERTVTVNAFRESEIDSASLVQAERGTTTQQRTITLPQEILPAGVKAALNNGVLTIVLPKAQPTEGPRRVKVQG